MKLPSKEPGRITFSEDWNFYPRNINNQQVSVRFDMSVGNLEEKVKKKYPHTIEIMVPYIETDKGGFPTPSEMERVNVIEDGFSRGKYDVRLIGVLTGGCCSRFVFCSGGTEKDVEEIVRTLMGANAKIDFSYKDYINDNFGFYWALIAPSEYDDNWMNDRGVCDNIAKAGDNFTEPREIDFYCYFDSTKHIQTIAEKLRTQGFREVSQKKTEDGEYMLHVTLNGIPTLPRINEITSGILDMLEGTDGYFDGWGCPIVK